MLVATVLTRFSYVLKKQLMHVLPYKYNNVLVLRYFYLLINLIPWTQLLKLFFPKNHHLPPQPNPPDQKMLSVYISACRLVTYSKVTTIISNESFSKLTLKGLECKQSLAEQSSQDVSIISLRLASINIIVFPPSTSEGRWVVRQDSKSIDCSCNMAARGRGSCPSFALASTPATKCITKLNKLINSLQPL